jgi:hypothetical protein
VRVGELDAAQVASEAERLGTVADQLIAGRTVYAPNRRLLDHLGCERGAVYFRGRNGVQADQLARRARHRSRIVCRKAWLAAASARTL